LGIDAPELKQKQSYAAESRDYVKKLCEKKQLFLEYGPEAKDHYGRTLAFIWVQQSDGEFVLVNERVLSVGLARFYTPGKEPLQHGEVMLRSQAAAKSSKSGIWKDFTSKEVIVTKFGKAYHKQGCKHLANSKNTFVRCESDVLDQVTYLWFYL
jgi:endonuclease YncB( thermonuclease family)